MFIIIIFTFYFLLLFLQAFRGSKYFIFFHPLSSWFNNETFDRHWGHVTSVCVRSNLGREVRGSFVLFTHSYLAL